MDRLEWFTEKSVEIGIDEISLLNCRNSERVSVKTQRLNKVSIAAVKQSLKAYLPLINELVDFKKFILSTSNFAGQKFIAHCYPPVSNAANGSVIKLTEARAMPHLKTIYSKGSGALILIGPEGDFSMEEVKMANDNGFKEISLGSSRLRTETAALYACATVNILNE